MIPHRPFYFTNAMKFGLASQTSKASQVLTFVTLLTLRAIPRQPFATNPNASSRCYLLAISAWHISCFPPFEI